MSSRMETYKQLIMMGFSSEEAWEQIEQMDFADDYEEDKR